MSDSAIQLFFCTFALALERYRCRCSNVNSIVVVRVVAGVGGELVHSLHLLLFYALLLKRTNVTESCCHNTTRLVQHERNARLSFAVRCRGRQRCCCGRIGALILKKGVHFLCRPFSATRAQFMVEHSDLQAICRSAQRHRERLPQ